MRDDDDDDDDGDAFAHVIMTWHIVWQEVVVWPGGNVIGRINKVPLRRAWLVLGWVTVFGG